MEGQLKKTKATLAQLREKFMDEAEALTMEQMKVDSDIIADLDTTARWLVSKHVQTVRVISLQGYKERVYNSSTSLVTLLFDHTDKTICLRHDGCKLCDKDGKPICTIRDTEAWQIAEEEGDAPLTSESDILWAMSYMETNLRCYIIDYVTRLYKNSDGNTLDPQIIKRCF